MDPQGGILAILRGDKVLVAYGGILTALRGDKKCWILME